jgi:L-asparaginase
MPDRPDIAVLSLGGTIAMTPDADSGGAVPRLGPDDLLAAVPQLRDVARLRTSAVRQVPGAHLTLEDVIELASAIEAEVASGADGIVVTQGTDTIEEVAFALDLLLDTSLPVVVTGAMRPAHLAGADGPANLLDAVRAASSAALHGVGTVVVLGGEIHAARLVVKTHTQSPAAFGSPLGGPLGWVGEGRPRLVARPAGSAALELPRDLRAGRVALLTATLGDDGTLLRAAVAESFDGIVVEALGGGHLPEAMLENAGHTRVADPGRRDPERDLCLPRLRV